MPDIAVHTRWLAPTERSTFNDGGADQFYIQEIQGLVGVPVRTPIDEVPFGHGGISHNFWETGRPMIFDGLFLITSERSCDAEMAIRNQMEDDLRVALRSISSLVTDTGTLTWTPRGQGTNTLTVRCNVPPECIEDQGFLVRNFHFGLWADVPDWDGWDGL